MENNVPALFLAVSCNATAEVAILTCLFSSSSSIELSSDILSSYAFCKKVKISFMLNELSMLWNRLSFGSMETNYK